MASIGYARVSTDHQTLNLQLDALSRAGVEKVFQDEGISGSNFHRKGLEECLDYLRKGDTLVVWRFDRLGRSVLEMLKLVEDLHGRGVQFRSLTENVDTSTPQGRMFFTISLAFAEMEREVIRERVREGLRASRQRGRVGGRPHKLSPEQEGLIVDALRARRLPARRIAEEFGITRSTVYRIAGRESEKQS